MSEMGAHRPGEKQGFTLRPAQAVDLPAVARLAAKLVRFHHAMDPLRYLQAEHLEEGYERFLRTRLVDEHTILWVAEEYTTKYIIGYVFAAIEPRSWEELLDRCGKIHDLYVDERARGRGVGHALLEGAIAEIEAHGVQLAVLLTAAPNEAAQALFRSHGFRTTTLEMSRELKKK